MQVAVNSTQTRAKRLASITGKIISMSIAMGLVTRLMTTSMYVWAAKHPETLMPIPPDNRAITGRAYLLASTVRYL